MLRTFMRGLRSAAAGLVPVALSLAACGSSARPSPSSSATASPGGATSVIAAPASTCASFASGKLAPLARLTSTTAGGTITKTDPSTFAYWVRVTPSTTSLAHLTVTATTHGATATLNPTGGQVEAGSAGGGCAPVTNSVTFASGPATVTFGATAGTTYYAQVVYSALPLVGQKPGSAPITVTIATDGISGSSATISVAAS